MEKPSFYKNGSQNYSEAKKRWKLLSAFVTGVHARNNEIVGHEVSIRRFNNFGLLNISKLSNYDSHITNGNADFSSSMYTKTAWFSASLKAFDCSALVCLLENSFDYKELAGFNNTGNVCIWPSEEVMAFKILQNPDWLNGKVICELGGGMTGLTGLFASINCCPKAVHITDGNEKSVQNVERILLANRDRLKCPIMANLLKWGRLEIIDSNFHKNSVDLILCADCFFFVDCHKKLLETVEGLLTHGGTFIGFAPSRSGTLEKFEALLRAEGYDPTVSSDYNEHITQLHREYCTNNDSYDPNLHYPHMLSFINRKS